MRPRSALALVAIIGTLTLGAALAQESPAPAAPQDPFLRVLAGGAAPAAAAAAAPCDPAAPAGGVFAIGVGAAPDGQDGQDDGGWITVPGEPANAPHGIIAIDGSGGLVELASPDGVYQYLLAGDDAGGWVQSADPAVLSSLFALGGDLGSVSGHVHLRATLREGVLAVTRDGQPLPAGLIVRDGSTVRVRDEEGRLVATFEIDSEGRATIPAGWSFSGPLQWLSERPSRRVIGIRTGAVEPALARHLGLGDGEGVLVTEVIEGHPAAEAGLEPLDVIVAIDGARPATLESLKDALAEKSEGDTISLTVARAGRTMEIRCGVSSVSAPIGAMELPSGAYALGLSPGGGMGRGAGAAAGEAAPEVPLIARSVPLLLRRGMAGAPGSAPAAGGGESSGNAPARHRIATMSPGGIVTLSEAPAATASPESGSGRLGAIEERLDRLEQLLEQLLEQRARSPEPRERR